MEYFLGLIPTILTIATIYALAASGYTLIHAATRQFHLAVGALFTLGGYVAFTGFTLLDIFGFTISAAVLAGALILALVVSAAGGAGLHAFTLFHPGGGANPTAPLVVTVGLGIAAAEAVRLLHASHTLFAPTPFPELLTLEAGGRSFVMPMRLFLVFPLGLLGWLAAEALVRRSGFGRAFRAVADDPLMARLIGISVERIVLATFVLGAALTGLAGALSVERYGSVSPYMGLILSLKAIAAAVIGGIGSLPGALVAALGIAAVETWWTAYVAGDYRDVVVFVLLVLALIFRPDGLFARPVVEPVAGAGAAQR